MTKTPEEKAREYAKITPDVQNIEKMPKECAKYKDKYNDYLAGYTEAISDNQPQLTAYREALKEITKASDSFNLDSIYSEIAKAKQLLKDSKDE